MASFRAAVLRGPDIGKDGVNCWTAKGLCRTVEKRYEVSCSENGMLKLLKSLDLSWQKTRPVHPKADPRAQALLVMDRAGWHCANDLIMPENIKAVFLPPYSPEINSIERLWLYLKERFLSLRLWYDYDAIVDAVCQAWQQVTADTGRIKSLCSMEWARAVRNWWGWYETIATLMERLIQPGPEGMPRR